MGGAPGFDAGKYGYYCVRSFLSKILPFYFIHIMDFLSSPL